MSSLAFVIALGLPRRYDAIVAYTKKEIVYPVVQATCAGCGAKGAWKECPSCGAFVQTGPYVVEQILNRTDRGGVYVVTGTGGLRLVLKEIKAREAPTQRVIDAWEREAALLLAFSHPRVPKFLHIFREGTGAATRYYRIQQYVEGESLRAQIKRFPFEESRVRDIGRQVLEVLELLHGPQMRLAHGNIKAKNLILDSEGMLSIVDFGETSLTPDKGPTDAGDKRRRTNIAAGDVYDFGVMMVELLARKDPAEFLDPDGETNLEEHLQTSRDMLALLKRVVCGPPHSRIETTREVASRLRSVQVSQRQIGMPRWKVALLLFTGAAAFCGFLYFETLH